MSTTRKARTSAAWGRLATIMAAAATFTVACGDSGTGTGDGSGASAGTGGGSAQTGTGGTGTSSQTSSGADPFKDDDGDGLSEAQGDCDDTDASIPGPVEVCGDGKDNNCNGATDGAEPDGDGDGFGLCAGDCDDANPLVSPAIPEKAGDGIDNNCDGTIDADIDGDGFATGDGDCDDSNDAVFPGALENCYDGVDNDCNGFADAAEPDADNDGYGPCTGDCDDTNQAINPGSPEVVGDGVDNNCDFLVDGDADADGWTTQNGDCNDQNPLVNPAILETCGDNIDNDCDGTIDTDCLTKCQLADIFKTSVGCVYYAVDMNNDPAEGYDSLPYAVVVSNTDPSDTATVNIQTKQGGVWTTIQSFNIPPNQLHQFNLPDRHVNYTNVNLAGAYKIVANVPVVAYQFQPIDGVNSFTSDASLLIPTSALDRFYYNIGWGKPSFGNPQVAIVVAEDGTQVTMTPTTPTLAGGAIPALAANVAYTFPTTYNAGDVIQIEASGGGNAGLGGSFITANKPIALFSGNWCANVPTQVCCCDHLEEQLFGVQTWGKTYVGARHPVRNSGTPEAAYWQIVAAENGTTVSFRATPGTTGLPATQVINQGQVISFGVGGTVAAPGDFIVTADKPILVMQYMTSSQNTNASVANAGDPFMTQAVPVEQFLDHYIVLAPVNWVNDRMVITKRVGETVTIDGNLISQASFVTINDGVNPPQWEVGRISVGDGFHSLTGTAPFGVTVLGFDSYDSYGYPGGLNQQVLNPMN